MVLQRLLRLWRRFVDGRCNEGDTSEDRETRRVALSAGASALLVTGPIAALEGGATAQGYTTAAHFLNFACGFVLLCFHPSPPRVHVGGCLLVATVLLCVADWDDSASMRVRSWNLVVVILDVCLLTNVATSVTRSILGVTILWLCVQTSEEYSRYGLYEVAGHLPGQQKLEECDCASPPCAKGSGALPGLATFLLVFLFDFYLTRGFAHSMRHQMSVVQAMIDVTEAIAQRLALYQVEEGRALLDGDDGAELPDGLRSALVRLLNNLDEYRPFLPETLMREEGVDLSAAEPPGLGQEQPTVTMCFTDIQSSTELWDGCPQGMHTALGTHNDLMRMAAKDAGGYEVKVIGDAFMLAFKTAEDGCRFALDAQEALVDARWPSDLLQHPLCTPTVGRSGAVLWNGPRVRIGVNSGAVRVEKNPVTGRCDYFGPAVNVAARVEACLRHGGLTGVTRAVLDELTPAAAARLRAVEISLGPKELKGVSAPVEVTVLLSERLSERRSVLSAAATTPAPQADIDTVSTASSMCSSAAATQRVGSVLRVPSMLREGLQRRPAATCSTFRARAEADMTALGSSVVEMLEVVEQAADVTQGVVAAVVSVQCLVVWNGPRACDDHYAQCLRASDVVRRSSRRGIASGACSGEALHGNVAGGRRKHAAVVGGCVELSSSLAEAAEGSGEAALAATTFAQYCTTQKRTRRHADWPVRGGTLIVLALTAPAEEDERWCGVAAGGGEPQPLQSLEGEPSGSAAERLLGAGVALRAWGT